MNILDLSKEELEIYQQGFSEGMKFMISKLKDEEDDDFEDEPEDDDLEEENLDEEDYDNDYEGNLEDETEEENLDEEDPEIIELEDEKPKLKKVQDVKVKKKLETEMLKKELNPEEEPSYEDSDVSDEELELKEGDF